MFSHTQIGIYCIPMMMANGPVYLTENQVRHVDTQDAGTHSFPNSVQEGLSDIKHIVGIKEQRGQIEGTISSAGALPINDPADLTVLDENIGRVEVEMHHIVCLKLLIPVRRDDSLQHMQ